MAREARQRILELYVTENGHEPFTDWLASIRHVPTRARIRRYVDRIASGNFGDHKRVGEGVFEMRLFFGPGYRLYFAEDGDTLVILLCGGDKSTQKKDIKNALTYWADYKERTP